MESLRESILERAKHKREKDRRVNDRMMQSKKRKDNSSKAFDPMVEVQLSAEHNILANEQHHSEQSASVYDIYLLEKVDRNTTPESIDMSHRRGEIDQNADVKKFENADLKAQIQEKVLANAALKNELRKSKGNSVDTKFAKPSILGKPVYNLPETNPFLDNRLRIIKKSYGSNDMARNYYLEEGKKKTQDKNKNLKPREMPSAKTHHTPNACTPKPRINNQTSRNWPASKSCEETLKARQKAYHSRNPSLFLDFKHFVCSTCQKCVFNANHDACITKFLEEVNSCAKIKPNKTRNSNKPIDPTSYTQKPGRKIITGHSFSPNKSCVLHEKTKTPRSCLRWIPTGRIFNTAGLKWVPTEKTFTSSTTKVDCEPPNPYKCDQTLNVSANQHPCFMIMASVDNTSGIVPYRKERTMDMTIDQQVALDEALVPHASKLRIRKSNFHLRSDITSKESTLQLVFDVLRLTPSYKAFLVTADVPEIYMEMLHICPRLPGQTFNEIPFEEEILAFLRFLRHSGEIRRLIDGMYHKKNVDYAYHLWEDFVYQVEHKDAKKSNEMYYLRFTKVIIHYFMTKDPSIPRRNKFDVMLPIELTNKAIRNSKAYKEYYAVASGAAPPKTKASVRKTKSSFDTTITPQTAAGTRLSTSTKGKQPAKASKEKSLTMLSEVAMTEAEQIKLAIKKSLQQTHISQASGSGADEGTGVIPGVPDIPTEESHEEISWKSSDEDDDDTDEGSDDQYDDNDQDDDDQAEGDDYDQDEGNDDDQDTDDEGDEFIHLKLTIHEEEETKDEESFDPIVQTTKNSDDKGNYDANLVLNVSSEEGQDAEDDKEELYKDVNINLEGDVHTTQEFEDTHVTLTPVNHDGQQQSSSMSSQFVTSMLKTTLGAGIDSFFETTSQIDVSGPTIVASLTLSAPTLNPPTIHTSSQVQQAPTPLTTAPSTLMQDLPNLGSLFGFDHRLKTLEANFFEFVQTNQFAGAVSSILVSKILPKIEKTMNEQLEAEVLTRSSKSSKTSHTVAADLSEMELKKILIQKMESNKSIHRFDKQRNLYNALVEAYEYDKIILDTYGDIVTDLAKQDDYRSSFNELMDTPVDFSAFLMNRLKVDTLTLELIAGPTYELMKGSCKSLVELEFFLEEVYKATTNQLDWNNPEGQQYPHNLLKPLPLIPSSRGRRVIPFVPLSTTTSSIYVVVPLVAINREFARDVYSKRRIIAVTKLQIVEWRNYKHLDWIMVRRDNDKLYKFKEGDFKRLRIQDIEDMLRLLLGVENYQKKLNLTKPDAYCFDLKHKEAYTAYSNPREFIYQNKDNQNRLIRIDKLHKFSDGTLNDVRTALDDRLKVIRMKYLPQAIWRKSDKERAAAMI
nr:hypothetical protein [Tanacetum cinerariifolium]